LETAQNVTEFLDLRILIETALPGLPINPAWRAQLSENQRTLLRSLIFRLHELEPTNLEDKDWFRSQLGALLGAVGRPEDAKVLQSWIEEERSRRAVEDAEWQAKIALHQQGKLTTRRLGPRTIRMAWNSWCEALAQLGGSEAADALLRYIRVPEFLGYASWGLVRLLKQTEAGEPDKQHQERAAYAEIYERQRKFAASAGSQSVMALKFADAVYNEISKYLPALPDPQSKLPRQELFNAAAALARLDHERAVPVLLKVCSDKRSHWGVAMALHGLMLDGVLLPGKEVASALEPFIAEHEEQPWSSGQDNWYAVVECLALLLFSDDPCVGVERIRHLPPNRLNSYHVRDILGLLGICRVPEAGELLVSFSTVPEITAYSHELLAAMSASQVPAVKKGVLNFLDRLAAGKVRGSHEIIDALAKAIAHFAEEDLRFWELIKARCEDATDPAERAVLAEGIHVLGTEDAALAGCDLIRDNSPIVYPIEQLIRAAAENRIPAGGQGAYYLEPRNAGILRRRLFQITLQDSARKKSAMELLAVIADCRVEHGQPPDEPFHPDIDLLPNISVPWPLLD
jgi:hypothetical protein